MTTESLSDKIIRFHIKAEMVDTIKWGRIPMIKLPDGSYCAEQISFHFKSSNVKEAVKRVLERIDGIKTVTYNWKFLERAKEIIKSEFGKELSE